MATSKIAITIDQNLLYRLDFLVKSQRFTNRSRVCGTSINK